MTHLNVYCDADIVAKCSYSGCSTHYPVRYYAGQIVAASEIRSLIRKPSLEWIRGQLNLGHRLAHCDIKAVRLYRDDQYLLGGYFSNVGWDIQWVQPVTTPAQRAHVEHLVSELNLKANQASYMGHVIQHSALILSLALVDGDHGLQVQYNGTAPQTLMKSHQG